MLREKQHLWHSRKPSKFALELAFYTGATVSERSGMLKTYELVTRHFGWDKPPKPEHRNGCLYARPQPARAGRPTAIHPSEGIDAARAGVSIPLGKQGSKFDCLTKSGSANGAGSATSAPSPKRCHAPPTWCFGRMFEETESLAIPLKEVLTAFQRRRREKDCPCQRSYFTSIIVAEAAGIVRLICPLTSVAWFATSTTSDRVSWSNRKTRMWPFSPGTFSVSVH